MKILTNNSKIGYDKLNTRLGSFTFCQVGGGFEGKGRAKKGRKKKKT